MNRIVGLDLGGTHIKAVLVDEAGQLLAHASMDTQANLGPDRVIDRLNQAVELVCQQGGIRLTEVWGIGIGSPGPLSSCGNKVVRMANLPGWDHVELRQRLQARTSKPTVLLNDANAAAYGEYWVGAARQCRLLNLLTLGTGVGGGVVCNGEIFIGHHGNGAEFGHMIVFPEGRHCRCGQRGCLEAYAAGSYLIERATEQIRSGRSSQLADIVAGNTFVDVPDIIAAAEEGDLLSRDLWDEACQALAIACVNLYHIFNPELILLGGGMAAAGQLLLKPVTEKFHQLKWDLADDQPRIELGQLGSEAGAIGAAGWCWHMGQKEREKSTVH